MFKCMQGHRKCHHEWWQAKMQWGSRSGHKMDTSCLSKEARSPGVSSWMQGFFSSMLNRFNCQKSHHEWWTWKMQSRSGQKEARSPGVLLDARLFQLHPGLLCKALWLAIWNSHTDTWCIDCWYIYFAFTFYQFKREHHLLPKKLSHGALILTLDAPSSAAGN